MNQPDPARRPRPRRGRLAKYLLQHADDIRFCYNATLFADILTITAAALLTIAALTANMTTTLTNLMK